jgi:hypothetical protein
MAVLSGVVHDDDLGADLAYVRGEGMRGLPGRDERFVIEAKIFYCFGSDVLCSGVTLFPLQIADFLELQCLAFARYQLGVGIGSVSYHGNIDVVTIRGKVRQRSTGLIKNIRGMRPNG